MRRFASLILTAAAVTGLATAFVPAAAAVPALGTYQAVAPTRILDTRTAGGGGPIAGRQTRQVTVAGGVVPAAASAVVLTVTVTAPTAGGYLTVYPAGQSRPTSSTLNFTAGRTVPNLVVVGVGSAGSVQIYNASAGRSQVLVDVSGYYTGSAGPAGLGAFGTVPAPRRVLDTRNGTGGVARAAVAGRHTVSFAVTGSGVPSNASAVVLNVSVTAPAAGGYVTAYPSGAARPTASNLNFVRGLTVANLVVVPVGSDGRVTLYNGSAGSVHLFADISGYFLAGDPVAAGTLGSLAPARLLDTRTGSAPVAARHAITMTVAGRAGVPITGVSAVVLSVTATQGTRSGYLTVYGSGTAPRVSNVNYSSGQTVPDLVVAPVSNGKVTIYNGGSGSVQVFADVSGYVVSGTHLPPPTSVSRYVRNLTGAASDVTTLHDEGCADSTAGSTLVVLEFGAQSVTPPLSTQHPGVLLTGTSTRLTYDQLRTDVDGYLSGFDSCSTITATVAVGTSNDGAFTGANAYPAASRGADWANGFVAPLRSDAATSAPHVTVVGANDIEAGFSGSEPEAEDWESAYLGNTTVGSLLFNGSADGCPTTYAAPNLTCAFGWTEANYLTLAGGTGANKSRITALPQIYTAGQAVQWANIAASTGGAGLDFAGVLTENAACPTGTSPGCNGLAALPPMQGWAALYHSLSTIRTAPSIPAVTDLKIDA